MHRFPPFHLKQLFTQGMLAKAQAAVEPFRKFRPIERQTPKRRDWHMDSTNGRKTEREQFNHRIRFLLPFQRREERIARANASRREKGL